MPVLNDFEYSRLVGAENAYDALSKGVRRVAAQASTHEAMRRQLLALVIVDVAEAPTSVAKAEKRAQTADFEVVCALRLYLRGHLTLEALNKRLDEQEDAYEAFNKALD